MLVKRLVCIEDLGDIDILITDKTGTLTEGRISLVDAVDPAGAHDDAVLRLGLLATDVDPASGGVSANALDAALWEAPAAERLVTASAPSRDTAIRPCPPRDIGTASTTTAGGCSWSRAHPSK